MTLRLAVLDAVAARVRELPRAARVAVDGVTAAGKSTFADELAQLVVGAKRVTIDDFHRLPPHEYYPDSFDFERFRAHLLSLHETTIADGVFLHHPDLRDLWNLTIFLAVDRNVALERALARDESWMENARDRYATRYVPGETRYLAEVDPESLADIVVDNTDPHRPRLRAGSSPRPSRAARRLGFLNEHAKTYGAAGVSLATADAVVERLRAAVESTGATGFGQFAGLYPLDERRLLAASTDSVGSKLMLQRRAGKLRWGGMDLAAHCINDVLCSGATPLFFLDYVAAEHIELEQVAALVEGAAEVCRAAGCALIGGETAELPGVYREDELDFAGTCVGIVERDDVIDGSRCTPGDIVIGFPSSGLHTNGFSLVRALVGDGDFDAELLLQPHRLYLEEVRKLRAEADVKALAHVTGGGILGNLSRVLPEGVRASIDWDAWPRPAVYDWLAGQRVDEEEARRVFNLGIGLAAVVPEPPAGSLVIGRIE